MSVIISALRFLSRFFLMALLSAAVVFILNAHSLAQPFSCAVNHAVERPFGDMNGHSRLLHHEQVDPAQQCAAAGEHDAA